MGKNQHSKDRLFVTRTEYEGVYGGKHGVDAKESGAAAAAAKAGEVGLDHCELSLQLWENPVCTPDGAVFDILNVLPYVRRFQRHPVTGEPLKSSQLVRLHFARNAEGALHCPVTFRAFNRSSVVVAIRPSGNVFSYEAIRELCLTPRDFHDPISGEAFTRADIITLRDPNNLQLRRVLASKDVRETALAERRRQAAATGSGDGTSVRLPEAFKAAAAAGGDNTDKPSNQGKPSSLLEESRRLQVSIPAATPVLSTPSKHDHHSGVEKAERSKVHTTGLAAAGFTSTSLQPVTRNEMRVLTDGEQSQLRYRRIKSKGYVRLRTNFGALNVELHCDRTPRTCENFLGLAERRYYNGTRFHRLIPRFMLQGGDPTGSGRNGESFWGGEFADEIRGTLRHRGRGVLSMANFGPNTNRSQFFITFASAAHLDDKHTVFGQVVGGMDTLATIERVETDADDRPLDLVKIDQVDVLVNPFRELEKKDQKEVENQQKKRQEEKLERDAETMYRQALNTFSSQGRSGGGGVGKYLGKVHGGRMVRDEEEPMAPPHPSDAMQRRHHTKRPRRGG